MAGTGARAGLNPLTDWSLYTAVFLGGCLGTALRYGLSLIPGLSAHDFATLLANLLASFIYAALTSFLAGTRAKTRWRDPHQREIINRTFGMGFCGGLSTMSTLAWESVQGFLGTAGAGGAIGSADSASAKALAASGAAKPAVALALAYLIATFACGLVCSYIGAYLGARIGKTSGERV